MQKDIKYGKSVIRVQKTIYKDKTYLDIRKYYLEEDSGEFKPTRKGITIPIELAENVLKAGLEILNET